MRKKKITERGEAIQDTAIFGNTFVSRICHGIERSILRPTCYNYSFLSVSHRYYHYHTSRTHGQKTNFDYWLAESFFTTRQRSCAKVMFSQASVILFRGVPMCLFSMMHWDLSFSLPPGYQTWDPSFPPVFGGITGDLFNRVYLRTYQHPLTTGADIY